MVCNVMAPAAFAQTIAPPKDRPASFAVAPSAPPPRARPKAQIVTPPPAPEPQTAPAVISVLDTPEQKFILQTPAIPRPEMRPQDQATVTEPADTTTGFARPPARPASVASAVVARPQSSQTQTAPQKRTGFLGLFTNKSYPKSSTYVANKATERVNLPDTDLLLLGIYGKTGALKAMVQLPNGQVKQVKRGDKVEGGQITAITKDSVSFTRNGQTDRLKLPKG